MCNNPQLFPLWLYIQVRYNCSDHWWKHIFLLGMLNSNLSLKLQWKSLNWSSCLVTNLHQQQQHCFQQSKADIWPTTSVSTIGATYATRSVLYLQAYVCIKRVRVKFHGFCMWLPECCALWYGVVCGLSYMWWSTHYVALHYPYNSPCNICAHC